jgi:splicing factor 1
MAWRQQGSTGSNNIPLGNKRRFGGDEDGYNPSNPASGMADGGYQRERGRSPVRAKGKFTLRLEDFPTN